MVGGASNVQNMLTMIKMETFSKYAKFSEKLFLPADTQTYAFVSVGTKC